MCRELYTCVCVCVFLFPGSLPACCYWQPSHAVVHLVLWRHRQTPDHFTLMYERMAEREGIREAPQKSKQSNQQKGTNGNRCNLPDSTHVPPNRTALGATQKHFNFFFFLFLFAFFNPSRPGSWLIKQPCPAFPTVTAGGKKKKMCLVAYVGVNLIAIKSTLL